MKLSTRAIAGASVLGFIPRKSSSFGAWLTRGICTKLGEILTGAPPARENAVPLRTTDREMTCKAAIGAGRLSNIAGVLVPWQDCVLDELMSKSFQRLEGERGERL